jgi:hypothetical protein
MPNYDAGHYFLTVLAPVRLDSVVVNGQSQSRRHMIREALYFMPSGERTVATQGEVTDNPFARNTATHFARFAVLDDVVFNGRVSGNTLIDAILKRNPLTAQPVDRLTTPFLIFCADFDAPTGTKADLKIYLEKLWATMQPELTAVFQHCVGFEDVTTDEDFFVYITRCQIETTMPFNDYWTVRPALQDLDFKPFLVGGVLAAIVAVIGLFMWRPLLLVLGLAALAVVIFLAYRKVVDTAKIPFPKTAPPGASADLPTVLKALRVQREFTQLAIDLQGKTEQELYDGFGAFITATKPYDLNESTQIPGIIGV